ncbi:uncharacterized protein FIESC28_08618 [Fusarium coffeatum]|uniref:Uncharacterized protein n=1 Tax=Fusarium coffeatum TaxID=231269 RepID=A0A366R5R3_9HYPO|nr:uncharacterized protein FIESC28_08618 [Fusarium coffeatum]RBR12494.1 hypothetical protein FIESC28_08618 [Fusarium coffeatum]
MNYDSHVADESAALARSYQTVEASGSSDVAWNDLAYQPRCTIYELFEVHRRFVNRYLNQYFDCLDRLPTSNTELNENGISQELSTRKGLKAESNMSLLKISQATAVHDLKMLVEILDMIKEQERHQKTTNSPALAAWTVACSILALVTPHKVSSSAFQIGALAGALLFTVRLLWKPSSLESLDPVQHKLQALLRSFEGGTMKHHDRREVLIAELNPLVTTCYRRVVAFTVL